MQTEVNNMRLYYEKSGQGHPVILVHGNGEDHHIFDALGARLARRYAVYAPDSRDHGQSSRAQGLHYGDMELDMAAFIAALGLEKPVYVGFSDGGIVGLLLAMKHPGLLGAMVVCGANLHPRGMKTPVRASMRLGYMLSHDQKLALMLQEPDIGTGQLAGIRVPTLVLAGGRDIVYEDHTRMLAEAIPGAKMKILPGETHDSYLKKTDMMDELLEDFFAKVGYSSSK